MAAKTIAFVNKNDAGSTVRTYNLPFSKFDATAAPGVGDDDADGFIAGSLWADRTNHKIYICKDNATGAAVWSEIPGAGGGGISGSGTDNHVTRWDGTSDVQDSGVVIDDTDNVSGVTSIDIDYGGLKLQDTGGQHMVIHPVCNTGTFAGDRVLQIGMPDANTTLTLGGDLTTSGSFTTTLTVTGNTNVTLPTSGTLITQSQADAAYQPLDATLTALAGANWVANALPIGTGADTLSQTSFAANTFPARASTGDLVAKTITDFGLSLVDDADAAAGRTTLGGTTVGQNFFTLTNPSAVTFPRMNADNTVSALSASAFLSAIGGGSSVTAYPLLQNLSIYAYASFGTLHVELRTNANAAPSGSDYPTIPFRSSTLTTGTYTNRTPTASTTQSFSAGSYLGVSDNVPFRLWVVAIDDGGTVRLGLVNCYDGASTIYPLRDDEIITSVPEIGNNTATSAGVIYSDNAATVTITNASPAVITWTAHGLVAGQAVVFMTTGTLPTGITSGTTYYVISAGLSTNAFEISATVGGAAINTSSAGSGTHTGHAGCYQRPMRILGYLEWFSGLSSHTSWGSAPDKVQLYGPGIPLPGERIQVAVSTDAAGASGTTVIPADDTIPQNTEGDQIQSVSITPKSAANMLRVTGFAFLSTNTNNNTVGYCLFRDSGANALLSTWYYISGVFPSQHGAILHPGEIAGSTSATTYKTRMGGYTGTCYFNKHGDGNRYYGGSWKSYLLAEEVMA